jgi:hypothetical protein
MKVASTALKNLLIQKDEIRAIPKLTVEWEHNRFSPFATPDDPITVTPAITADLEWGSVYDLDSVALPNRPRSGIAKTRFNENGQLVTAGKYRDVPQSSRYYFGGINDPYKYWSSQQVSQTVLSSGAYLFQTPIVMTLLYSAGIVSNKIVVGFETSYAKPVSVTVEVTTNGTTWTNAGSSLVVDPDGKCTIWRTSSTGWSETKTLINPITVATYTKIRGVRLTVYSMNKPASHLDVLQLGARLESDLSEFVEDYDRDFEVSERSLIAPLGGASSNTASVSLNNMDRYFNNSNAASPFKGLIGKKARFTLDLSYDTTSTGGVADDRVRELTMWTESWGNQSGSSVDVQLKDSSVLLQEADMPKVFWGDGPNDAYNGQTAAQSVGQMTTGAVIWQIMDILGLANYEYSRNVLDNGQVIPYYWPEEDSTAWDEISAIAEGTQTAVYFDEYDTMRIKTRKTIFSTTENIDWNLDAIKNGIKLPDIVELETQDDFVANQVEITYKPTKYSNFNNGFPQMETVWEPEEETLTLRATALIKDLLTSHTVMWINLTEAAFWPYESLVNIRGEIIRYRGKEYVWRNTSGTLKYTMVYSQEDKDKLDAQSDPYLSWQNSWSGKLAITERGVQGSGIANHYIKPSTYTTMISDQTASQYYQLNGNTCMNYLNGVMTLSPPSTGVGWGTYLTTKHETAIFNTDSIYGTRIRFPSAQIMGDKTATAGIYFAGDAAHRGYRLEISPTEFLDASGNRAFRNEISLQCTPDAGWTFPISALGGTTQGFAASILYDQWYDVDIRHAVRQNYSADITVYLNGVFAGTWSVDAGTRLRWSDVGKFGLFTRSVCKAEFEYLYAINTLSQTGNAYKFPEPDSSAFLDIVRGGFVSGFIEREWRYGYFITGSLGFSNGSAKAYYINNSRGDYVFDEFGPVVHEIREFEVTFDDDNTPVSNSFLYLSNESQVICTDYTADPFGAKFTLVNTSRENAILKGSDSVMFTADNSVDQTLFVYGRLLKQEDDLTVTKKDKASIRKNGLTALEIDSKYIQT